MRQSEMNQFGENGERLMSRSIPSEARGIADSSTLEPLETRKWLAIVGIFPKKDVV
jgi:hypothetical protein